MALPNRSLSGSALLSALVDLLIFFFLWTRNWALLGVAVDSINPLEIKMLNHAALALEQVTRTPHLSRKSRMAHDRLPSPHQPTALPSLNRLIIPERKDRSH